MSSHRILAALAHAVGFNKQTETPLNANQRANLSRYDFVASTLEQSFAGLDEWGLGDAILFGTGHHEEDQAILGRLAKGVLSKDPASIANRDILEQILSDGGGCLPGEKNVYYVVDQTNTQQNKELLSARIRPTKVPFRTNYWGASSYAAMGGSGPDNWAIVISHVSEDFGPLLYGSDVSYGGSSRMYLSDDALEVFNRGIVGHIIPSASLSNCWPAFSLA